MHVKGPKPGEVAIPVLKRVLGAATRAKLLKEHALLIWRKVLELQGLRAWRASEPLPSILASLWGGSGVSEVHGWNFYLRVGWLR